jgi:hypothetical protein
MTDHVLIAAHLGTLLISKKGGLKGGLEFRDFIKDQ